MFPAADPIPIPAPVWLMKLLSYATLALHFCAVMILVGSLILVAIHDLRGRLGKQPEASLAASVIARRLPVVMTYVINLGIPPLLFLQVLYGRAIYSSSVLIGAFWFSVIQLVMLDYWLLYRINRMSENGRSFWYLALAALVITMGVGQIYSMNMTLMLRPEVWQAMYAKSSAGLVAPPHDPTSTPRWLFVMAGGLTFGGLWALVLSNMAHLTEGVRKRIRRSGGLMAALGAVVQTACGYLVFQSQPAAVQAGLGEHPLYHLSTLAFLATIVLVAVLALLQGVRAISNVLFATAGLVLGFVSNVASVLVRDGIRDLTLNGKGFDVWKRVEASNWSVLAVFLALFGVMIGILIWLLLVMRRAQAPVEGALK